MNIKEIDLAYMAGIIDGEGCISAYRTNKKRKSMSVVLGIWIASTNEDLIDWVHNLFGGCKGLRISKISERKNVYVWNCYAKNVEDILRLVTPYLIIKKDQALLALEMREVTKRSGKNGGKFDEAINEEYNQIIDRFRILNKTGGLIS